MLPLEFVVTGTPRSAQARGGSQSRWRRQVEAAAKAVMPSAVTAVTADPVRATVVYFYVGGDLDLDNILKPILDSLKGIAYLDDGQIIDIVAAKRDLSGSYTLEGVAPVLAGHLPTAADDFVFVAVASADASVIP
jgi:crossover junction endodeoxyribonuclease RusA